MEAYLASVEALPLVVAFQAETVHHREVDRRVPVARKVGQEAAPVGIGGRCRARRVSLAPKMGATPVEGEILEA